jgi:hypothetical protein
MKLIVNVVKHYSCSRIHLASLFWGKGLLPIGDDRFASELSISFNYPKYYASKVDWLF